MKKTLIMIIAIVLVVSVCFALVGCPAKTPEEPGNTPCTSHVDANNDGKCDNCGTNMPQQQPDKQPSEAELQVANLVESYVNAWLVNNADSHSVNGLTSIATAYKNKYPKIISSIRASEQKEGGNVVGYTFTYSFKTSGAKYVQNIALPTANNGYHAGATFNGANGGVDSDTALGTIINAAFKTVKVAVENGQVFAENGFGFDATAYFDFYYGEMAQKLSYGLRVAGQIGIEAKDTFAGIEVLNGNDVIGGLYYEGADNKADCKLYLNAGDYKYYIDNADINAIVVSVIEAIQGIIGGGENVEGALETPFYNTEITKLSELLPEGSVSTIVGSILAGVIKDVNTTNLGGGNTQYQVQLNLGELLNSLLGEGGIGEMLGGITEQLPPPLNQLDLGSFQGVGGVLLITAVVNDNGLGGLEISYNAPKQDFRFSYEDDQPKVYGPINVAIGIKDFELGQQNASEVIPSDANSYDYFSPLNADVTVDVVVNEVAYSAHIVSDINPFAVENGVVTFVVSKDNEAWLNGRLEIVSPAEDANGWNGLVVVSVDGEVYKFYTGEAATAIGEVAVSTFASVLEGENVFTPIINYISDLIAQFMPEAQPEILPAGEEGGFDISAVLGAFDIVDAAKELIAQWQEDGVLVYNLNGETLWDNYLQVKLSADEYNAVIALVNQYIGPIIGMEIPDFENTAAEVFVSANYGDHAKQVYVTVDYKDVKVVVLLDGSKWESNKVVELSVDVNGDKYVAALDASEEGVYNVTYTAKGVTYVDVTVNTNDYTFAATLLANGNTHQFNGSLTHITEGDKVVGGTITLVLDGVEVSYTGKNLHGQINDKVTSFGVPTVSGGVEFGWKLPNNETNVSVNVTLNAWGETAVLADNADLMNLDATAELSTALQEIADAFLEAIAVEK